ncbi:MAG: hypothetical protein DWQ04_27375 [Chloroflexi bacterium]|nr:MAG: hypothetical protein DWQ04_27375 [Chloroflexota bacterium]
MKMNLLDTILIGTMLFGGIWSVLILYIIQLLMPENTKRNSQHKQGTHAYSAILRKIKAYRQNIEKLAAENEVDIHSYRLEKVLQSFDEWEAHAQQLINRLLHFEANKIVQHEQSILPRKIRNTRHRLNREKNPRLQKEIQETLNSYLRQQAQLDNLNFLMDKTQLDLEEFVAGIGAVYSQLQTIEAMDVHSCRAQRLAHEIEEERLELNDLLAAIDEVYDKSC